MSEYKMASTLSQAMVLRILFIFSILLVVVQSFPYFADRIPNGKRISHPCKPNLMWYGVGHVNYKGGGERNEFGKAFAKQGHRWTVCLCKEDSDGDGRTNGEELGDPDCVWSVGKIPDVTRGITHPGICDPFDGSECSGKNAWVDCSDELEEKCDALNEPDVQSFNLQFKKTKVPNEETTYICQSFNLSSKLPAGESHLIGTRMRLDNKNVMHHAIVYACDDSAAEEALQTFSSPVECGMAADLCPTTLAIWTVGVDVTCLNEKIGFLVGGSGYKSVIMELHWNNPELRDDYTDASGISLYVKTNKRPYDAGVWTIGSPSVIIPPAFPRYVNNGGCSSACTNLLMDQSLYITNLLPHMHYLGTGFVFQQYRNGIKIYELVVERYMYDDPHVKLFDPPLEVKPGDNIKIQCIFQSMTRKTYTFFGLSTQEEMCLGIMTYYPYLKPLDTGCLTSNGYGFCNNTLYPNPFDSVGPYLCNSTEFYMLVAQDAGALFQECDLNGFECYPKCKEVSSRLVNHPCWNGIARDLMRSLFAYTDDSKQIVKLLGSCEERPPPIDGQQATDYPTDVCDLKPPVGSGRILNQSFIFLNIWMIIMAMVYY